MWFIYFIFQFISFFLIFQRLIHENIVARSRRQISQNTILPSTLDPRDSCAADAELGSGWPAWPSRPGRSCAADAELESGRPARPGDDELKSP